MDRRQLTLYTDDLISNYGYATVTGLSATMNGEITSNDEIGRLARTFNVMIDVLRQRDRERQRKQVGRRDDPLGLGLGDWDN
jgi:hypothetical protein